MSLDWVLLGLRLLAAVILYTFLGVAFYLIWRDLKQLETRITAQSEITARLRVIETGTAATLVAGQIFPLSPVTMLGQAPDSTIVLPDSTISAKHARVSHKNGQWWLEGLDQGYSLKLNTRPLLEPSPLTHGDLIQLGDICFKLETRAE